MILSKILLLPLPQQLLLLQPLLLLLLLLLPPLLLLLLLLLLVAILLRASSCFIGDAFDLRCMIREQMIMFLQKNFPGCFPKFRAEVDPISEKKDKHHTAQHDKMTVPRPLGSPVAEPATNVMPPIPPIVPRTADRMSMEGRDPGTRLSIARERNNTNLETASLLREAQM